MSFSLSARTMDFGTLDIEINKSTATIKTTFNFDPAILGSPSLLFHNTLGRSFWRSGSARCQWRNIDTQTLSDEEVVVSATATCPDMKSDLYLDLALLNRAPNHYKIFTRINNNGIESTMLSSKFAKDIRIVPLVDRSFGHYITVGMAHIGAIPQQWAFNDGEKHPYRVDHVLFILALLFTGGTFLQTFKSVAGFSIGHSITFMLGTFGVFTLSQGTIDFAIVLSILIVASLGIFQKKPEHRFSLGLLFGLVHGFSFAQALAKMELSREVLISAFVGVNMGLLLGQVFIIALALPLFLMFKRYSNYYPQLLRGSSVGVFLVGCYWLVERAGF